MNNRNTMMLAATLAGISALGHSAPSAAATSYYMAAGCEATSGTINVGSQGHISNPSEVASATVQCPIVRNHHLNVDSWSVLIRDVNTSEDINCFLRSRTVLGSTLRSATATTPVPGYTGPTQFEYDFGIDTSWYPGTGGSALAMQCELPSAMGPDFDDQSWIFMYSVTEQE